MTLCYDVMNQNPEGAFTNSKGATVDSGCGEAGQDGQSLGDLIDRENELLKGAVKVRQGSTR
ncbi:MAG: hypothetical protein ACLU9S_20480 [Oscillospiraceae bacterium]